MEKKTVNPKNALRKKISFNVINFILKVLKLQKTKKDVRLRRRDQCACTLNECITKFTSMVSLQWIFSKKQTT